MNCTLMWQSHRAVRVRHLLPKAFRLATGGLLLSLMLATGGCYEKEERATEPAYTVPTTPNLPIDPDVNNPGLIPGGTYKNYVDPPMASQNYVFALNPSNGSVTVVNAAQANIQVVETGESPVFLQTIPGTDDALVLNIGSDDTTLIRVDSSGVVSTKTLKVVKGANTIVIAPDGKSAIIYFNAERQELTDVFGDFQTVSVVSFKEADPVSFTMSVGFKPRDVFFKNDSTEAYIVTDEGVSILNYAQMEASGSGIAQNVVFPSNNYAEEIEFFSMSPDGLFSISKRWNSLSLRMNTLPTGEETNLDLSGFFRVVSKWDLTPDWGGVLIRPINFSDIQMTDEDMTVTLVEVNNKSILRVPVPGGLTDPTLCTLIPITTLTPELVIPIPQTNRLLVYHSYSKSEKVLVIDLDKIPPGMVINGYDTDSATDTDTDTDTAADTETETDTGVDYSDAQKLVPLRKAVRSVSLSDDGMTAIIVHSKKDGDPSEDGIPVEERIDRSYGYSLLHPETYDLKLQLAEIFPTDIVTIPGKNYAFFLFSLYGENPVKEVHRINLSSFVIDPVIQLESAPVSAGYVSGQNKIFVNQNHPEGRITFIDIDTVESETVTGFILNSQIKD